MNWKNCVNGIVLWDRELGDFYPIIPVENMRNYEKKCINPEQLDLNGISVRFAYVPLPRLLETQSDGTRMIGLFGEAWNLIGEFLNFTTSFQNLMDHGHGPFSTKNTISTFSSWIKSNKTDIALPIASASQASGNFFDILSLTSTCYRLYIPPSFKSDDTWICRMIASDVLLILLAIMITMSSMSILIDKYRVRYKEGRNHPIPLSDHFFYTFATFVNQDSSPLIDVENLSRILTITKRMLAFLFLIMATANLFYVMSKKQIDAPFWDLPSFFAKSNMKLIIRSTSPGWSESLTNVSPALIRNRIEFVDKVVDMYKIGGHRHNTALWQSEYIHRSVAHKFGNNFVPIGTCMLKEGFAIFGISKTFHYKHPIFIGILKIRESGLLDIVKQHWLISPVSLTPEQYQSVSLKEVKTIFFLYQVGAVMSVFILIIEKIVIIRERERLRYKWNQQLHRTAQRLKIQHQR